MSKNILDKIKQTKVNEVRLLKEMKVRPLSTNTFLGSLKTANLSIIAEFKRHSPSKGDINIDVDLMVQLHKYQDDIHASAVSILTDNQYFKGSIDDVKVAKLDPDFSLPILRKDFIIDKKQIFESVLIGADAILLIVRMLSKIDLEELYKCATQLKLDVLFTAHNKPELEIACDFGAKIIGVNGRDLQTFEESLESVVNFKDSIPEGVVSVAESCVRTKQDFAKIQKAGFDAVLIGEALMKNEDLR